MCRCGVALGGDKSLGIVKRINRAAGSWIYYTSENAPGELTKAPEDSPKAQSDAQLKRTQIQSVVFEAWKPHQSHRSRI
jgi:hypothetical protein